MTLTALPQMATLPADAKTLRSCLRGSLALSRLPALWAGRPIPRIVADLAEGLAGVLAADFVLISLGRDATGGVIEALHPAMAEEESARLRRAVAQATAAQPRRSELRIPGAAGRDTLFLATARLGAADSAVLTAGARRSDFPTFAERFLLDLAATLGRAAIERRQAEEGRPAIAAANADLVRLVQSPTAEPQPLERTVEARVAERAQQLEAKAVEHERAEAVLRQAQKMDAISQLTGGIAHDINNLLMIIGGNVEMLRATVPALHSERRLTAIERATRRGEQLTRQLLAFSRRQPLQPRNVSLAARLPELVEMMRPMLGSGIEVVTKLDLTSEPWFVEIDLNEFELALLNMAVNARDAMPNGGKLTIAAGQHVLDDDERVTLGAGDEFIAISVTDTGRGIAPEILPRVFEPFFTTKEVGKGTGLGLSQVYGFAKRSGGTVAIESRLEQGTKVTMLLPRRGAASPLAPAADEEAALHMPRLSGVVLVVEDNDEVAEVDMALLAMIGYSAVRTKTAAEALSAVESGAVFDLVISDVVMPGAMNGIDLARTLHCRFPALPVLLTTGYSAAAAQAANEGLFILSKPYQREALAASIRRILSRRPNA